MRTVLVSACFLGVACDYRRRRKEIPPLVAALLNRPDIRLIPICPEQLGGLPTPRPPSEIQGGTGADVLRGAVPVTSDQGTDVTAEFIRGAEDALLLARRFGATDAVLQDRSPSCGVDWIYDGRFVSHAVPGQGVAAAALSAAGIRLIAGDSPYDPAEW